MFVYSLLGGNSVSAPLFFSSFRQNAIYRILAPVELSKYAGSVSPL